MSYIEFNHIVKEYTSGETKIRALDDASFTVEKESWRLFWVLPVQERRQH